MTFARIIVHSAMVLLVAGAMARPALAETVEVKIDNFTYTPQQITVKAGTTVV